MLPFVNFCQKLKLKNLVYAYCIFLFFKIDKLFFLLKILTKFHFENCSNVNNLTFSLKFETVSFLGNIWTV